MTHAIIISADSSIRFATLKGNQQQAEIFAQQSLANEEKVTLVTITSEKDNDVAELIKLGAKELKAIAKELAPNDAKLKPKAVSMGVLTSLIRSELNTQTLPLIDISTLETVTMNETFEGTVSADQEISETVETVTDDTESVQDETETEETEQVDTDSTPDQDSVEDETESTPDIEATPVRTLAHVQSEITKTENEIASKKQTIGILAASMRFDDVVKASLELNTLNKKLSTLEKESKKLNLPVVIQSDTYEAVELARMEDEGCIIVTMAEARQLRLAKEKRTEIKNNNFGWYADYCATERNNTETAIYYAELALSKLKELQAIEAKIGDTPTRSKRTASATRSSSESSGNGESVPTADGNGDTRCDLALRKMRYGVTISEMHAAYQADPDLRWENDGVEDETAPTRSEMGRLFRAKVIINGVKVPKYGITKVGVKNAVWTWDGTILTGDGSELAVAA